jgi:hypothetical protein
MIMPKDDLGWVFSSDSSRMSLTLSKTFRVLIL